MAHFAGRFNAGKVRSHDWKAVDWFGNESSISWVGTGDEPELELTYEELISLGETPDPDEP